MRPLPLVASIAAVLGSAQALAAPPTQPGDLRADVYSGTAAELFWARSSDPDGAVRAYEVRRDGELVATIDGLSYFTDALSDGQAAAFTITAIDFDGERSTLASVSVVGGDRDGAIGAGGGRPTPPSNLTSSVYSSSAAEVFWDRSDQSGLTYEVAVDGGPVLTTSGTSAFLSGLDSARGRGVDVVAIDANGQRSGAANVTLGGREGDDPSAAPTRPRGPFPPAELRGELYSSSAAEVFWDRVPGSDLSYEVSLDGEVVATTTGTSYFIGGRPGIAGTTIEVVAIGLDGVRSSVSSVALGSGGSSTPDSSRDAPPAPANARFDVYSDSAGELFWDRAPNTSLSYEILIDGDVIDSTSGTSYFLDDRPRTTYASLGVVAIDAEGRRSPVATVIDDSVLIGTVPEGIRDRVRAAVRAANAKPLEVATAIADRIGYNGDTSALGFEFQSSRPSDEPFVDFNTFSCPGGGAMTIRTPADSTGFQPELFFANCVVGALTINGDFVGQYATNNLSFPNPSYGWSIANFELSDDRDGSMTRIERGEVSVNPRPNIGLLGSSWSASGVSVDMGGTTLSIDSLSSGELDDVVPQVLGGSSPPPGFVTSISELRVGDIGPLRVETLAPFSRATDDSPYDAGVLQIVGDDVGYRVVAVSDQSATLEVLQLGEADAVIYTLPQSGDFRIDRFEPAAIDLGL